MAENQNEDLGLKTNEEGTSGDQPDATKTNPAADDGLKNEGSEETVAEKAEKLLADGTSASKEIKVSKETYDDRNKKAKIYEAHAVLIDKVLKDPALVEQLLETKDKGNLDERLAKLEEADKTKKRLEIKEAMTEALTAWPDLEQSWEEVKPIVESLTKSGLPYREALKRGYFAVNPEAAVIERERVAKEGLNRLGTFSSSQGYSPKPASSGGKAKMLNDAEKRAAKALGYKEEKYAELLDKHEDWLRQKGMYSVGE